MTHDNNGRSIEVTLFLQITQVERKAVISNITSTKLSLVDTATCFAKQPEMKKVQSFHGHELPALNFHKITKILVEVIIYRL